jgi:hypothetical protein
MCRCAGRNLPAIVLIAFSIISLAARSVSGDDKVPQDAARDAIVPARAPGKRDQIVRVPAHLSDGSD